MVMPCGFESHLSHQNSGYPLRGDRNFLCGDGTRKGDLAEGKVIKCPVDTLLARGRVPQISDASGTDVDGI